MQEESTRLVPGSNRFEFRSPSMITVAVLVENSSVDSRKMPGKHGLSLWIEVQDHRILYDFGPGRSLLKNSIQLGLDLSRVTLGVLSHSHIDHGGGLNYFFSHNLRAPVYAFHSVGTDYFTKLFGLFRVPVGVKVKEKYRSRLRVLSCPQEVLPGVHIVGFSTYSNPSSLNTDLLVRSGGKITQDMFLHESILVIEDGSELNLFNACSHHGVIASLETVSRLFPGRRIKNYFGGFHTSNPINGHHEARVFLEALGSQMAQWDVTYFTGHCTGDFPYSVLSRVLGGRLQRLRTGQQFLV